MNSYGIDHPLKELDRHRPGDHRLLKDIFHSKFSSKWPEQHRLRHASVGRHAVASHWASVDVHNTVTNTMRSMVGGAGRNRRCDVSETREHGCHQDRVQSEKRAHDVSEGRRKHRSNGGAERWPDWAGCGVEIL